MVRFRGDPGPDQTAEGKGHRDRREQPGRPVPRDEPADASADRDEDGDHDRDHRFQRGIGVPCAEMQVAAAHAAGDEGQQHG